MHGLDSIRTGTSSPASVNRSEGIFIKQHRLVLGYPERLPRMSKGSGRRETSGF